MFDLNQAIVQWRAALAAQPNLRNSDADELEDHLREEIAGLTAGGLSEEEAFFVAARRLGTPQDLSGEFAIADPVQRRTFRLSWMIIGALALAFLWLAADIVTNFGTGFLSRLPGEVIVARNATGLGWVAGVIRLTALVLGGVLIWRLLATDRSSRRLQKLSGVTVLGLSMLVAFLALAARTGSAVFVSHGLTPGGLMNLSVMNAWLSTVLMLALPVLLLVGLWRLVRS